MAEQFTNTFEGGMHKDFDPSRQPKGTYRDAKNCTIISETGNSYVVKDCMGNVLTFKINTPYDAVYTTLATPPMAIGFVSFPNRLIVFSTNNESTGGYLEIGEIKYIPYGQGVQPDTSTNHGYVPLYHSAYMAGTKKHRIEGFGLPEGTLTERVYWTDNNSEPRVFNVADPKYTTYYASGSLSATANTKYMVIEGAITYNGTNYGPGLTAGNVFSTTGGIQTYALLSASAKVIEYVPYELLSWTPDRKLGAMYFDGYGIGSVNCGSKVYFYRYGISDAGYFTPWSYPSAAIHVDTNNDTEYLTPSAWYTNTVGAGTQTVTVASDRSVKVLVDNIDTKYDIIQLAAAEYDNLSDTPRLISIVAQESVSITSTEIVLEHTGSVNLGTLTVDDVTLSPAAIKKIKTIDTDKNYILIGNITEREELNIDFTGANAPTLTQFEYQLPSYKNANGLLSYLIPEIGPTGNTNPLPGDIIPGSHWVVTDDSGGPVRYPFAAGPFYHKGDVFVGIDRSSPANVDTANIPVGSQVRPCIVKNQYTTQAAIDVPKVIEMKNDHNFWDYKDPLVHQELTSYWGTETYRFGALFYDLKGNPYYVRWIGDYTFNDNTSKGGLTILRNTANPSDPNFICLNPSGLKVSDFTIPASEINKISGFSIVRAVRDARVICQGLVSQCTANGGAPNVIYPGSYIPITYDTYGANVQSKSYVYISPDILSSAPLKGNIGVIGDRMEGAGWFIPVDFGLTDYVGAVAAQSEQAISKIIYPLTADTTARTGTISYWANIGLSEYRNVGTSDFNNQINLAIGSPSGLLKSTGTGEKKVYFTLENDFLHYGPSANGYTSNAANGQSEKILMNYVKSNFTNPYGGTGAQALANTLYISTGHYQPINATVKADTLDGNGNYTFNNIEVWGGDCYINMIDYGYGLWNKDFVSPPVNFSYSYAWQFPCECNSNYNLRRGRKQTNSGMYYTGDPSTKSIVYNGASSEIRLENYQYNPGYSTEGQTFLYPALPFNYINQNTFKARVRFAGPKFINEISDSFRTFLTNDYKDLDVQQGRINSIKTKEGRVFVWQDLSINTVPVLERQLLSNLPGAVTNLGTGGVVDRFDPINSYFGTQHQWSVVPTEFGFVYFDMRHKALVALDAGIGEISFIGGMSSFFNEIFNEVSFESNIVDQSLILNSPTFADTSDMPLMGVGITGVYDPKFKMTYMTFKFYQQSLSGIYQSLVKKDFTIAYYHPNKVFSHFVAFEPAIAHNHNNIVLMSNDPKNKSKYYGANMNVTIFDVGDTTVVGSVEYLCVVKVVIDSFPPSNPIYAPDYAGSEYWTAVNQTNEVWVLNQPSDLTANPPSDYQYNKFFGKVVSNEFEVVVNPPTENAIACTNIEQQGNLVNATDVYTEAEVGSASDLSISPTSRLYSRILDKICSSLPLYNGSRLTGTYLKIKFVKKNYTSNPTVLTGAVRILRKLNTFFEQKR